MPEQTSFEERLKRLESKASAPAHAMQSVPAMGGGGGMGGGTPRGSGGSGRNGGGGLFKIMLALAIVFCVTMAGLFYYTLQQTNRLAGISAQNVAATLQGERTATQEPGLARALLGFFSGSDSTANAPIDFLPNPGQGWVRVTQTDAKSPDIQAQIDAQWPSDAAPLASHLGAKHLDHFLRIYQYDDIEEQVLSKKRTRAMYMHPDGDFVSVRLQVLPERNPLGAADDTDGWISALANRETEDLEAGEILEIVEFSGISSTNRTKPAGQSLLSRPIGNQRDIPNGIAVSVPLSYRVVIRFDGLVQPQWIDQFLAAMDLEALRTQFSATDP